MSYLIIADLPVKVRAPTGPKIEWLEIGETVRAFSGAQRTAVRAKKLIGDFTTTPLLIADSNAIVAAVADRAFVTVTGNAIDGAVITATVVVKVNPQQIGEKITHRRVLDLHIEEV